MCPCCRPRVGFLLLKAVLISKKLRFFFQIMRITGIDCHVLLVPDLKEDATSSAQVDSPRHSLYLRFLAVVAFDFLFLLSKSPSFIFKIFLSLFSPIHQDNLVVFIRTDVPGLFGVGESDANPWMLKAAIEAPSTHTMGMGLKDMLIGEGLLL